LLKRDAALAPCDIKFLPIHTAVRRNVARELARLDLVGEISILDQGVLQQVSTSSDVLAAPSSTG